jgi:hypothetical protein
MFAVHKMCKLLFTYELDVEFFLKFRTQLFNIRHVNQFSFSLKILNILN